MPAPGDKAPLARLQCMRGVAFLLLLLVATGAAAGSECPCPRPKTVCDALEKSTLPDLSKTRPARIDGVFVVFDEGIQDWTVVLERLACAGIKHVIIQSLRFDTCEAKKLLRAAAAQTAVKVYAGLAYCGRGFHPEALTEDAAIVGMVERWPEDVKKGISGWYIAHEPYNEQVWISDAADPEARLAQTWLLAADIQEYLKATARQARAVRPGDVLISPYFVPTSDGGLLTPANTKTFFEKMFKDTGVTRVLMQDSIGARNERCRIGGCRWSRCDFEPQVLPYLQAVRDGVKDAGVGFGVNVEAFEISATDSCGTATVAPAYFKTQRKLATTSGAPMVVTFSLKHLHALWSEVTTCAPPY